jgi:hypothetical protein
VNRCATQNQTQKSSFSAICEAALQNNTFTAALKRCATQKHQPPSFSAGC